MSALAADVVAVAAAVVVAVAAAEQVEMNYVLSNSPR